MPGHSKIVEIEGKNANVKISRARSLLLQFYCTIVFYSVKNEHNIFIKVLITFCGSQQQLSRPKAECPVWIERLIYKMVVVVVVV